MNEGEMDVVVQRPTDTWARVISEPRFIDEMHGPNRRMWDLPECPKCECDRIGLYEVDVENAYLRGGKGKASYCQCMNCDWRSEMVARSDQLGR